MLFQEKQQINFQLTQNLQDTNFVDIEKIENEKQAHSQVNSHSNFHKDMNS